jgi:sugar/nucleoside kinase (ribokinase family)
MSLVVVGSVALDSVETPFGRRDDALGGSASFFSTAAAFFTAPKMVAVVGEDFPQAHLDFFKARGIALEGVTRQPGKTFRWRGKYSFQLNEAQTLETQLNVFQHFAPKLPDSYRTADYVFLGNIHPDLQAQVVEQVRSPKLVAADTMNFWISGHRAALERTLKRVHLLFVNDAEARQLAGEHNIVRAAKAILGMGPDRLVVKRGEYGALLFDREYVFACPAYPLADVFDPTGAGDSFAGGFMGHLARVGTVDQRSLRQAMVMGSVLASFAVEKFSLERLTEIGKSDIDSRYADFRKLTHFDEISAGT